MKIKPVISKNNADLIKEMKEFLSKYKVIKSVNFLDESSDNSFIIICDEILTEDLIQMWWNGYKTAVGEINE